MVNEDDEPTYVPDEFDDEGSEDEDEDEFLIGSCRYPQVFHIPSGYAGKLGTLLASPDGKRVMVGADTGEVRMFDMSTINKGLLPYQVVHSVDHQPITALSLSSCSSLLLVVGASKSMAVVNVITGRTMFETVKGDMYLKNPSHTYGHKHHVTAAAWHPFDSERFASSSLDGTIRLWNLSHKLHGIDEKLPQSAVFAMPDERGRSTGTTVTCTAVEWSPTTAKLLISASSGGDVGLWDERSNGFRNRPEIFMTGCHDRLSGGVSSVHMMANETHFVTRGTQDDPEECIKIWDIRKANGYAKTAEPLSVIKGVLPRVGGHMGQRLSLSHSGKYVSVIEGGKSQSEAGQIRVWDTDDPSKGPVASYPPGFWCDARSPVDVQYCPEHNQVVALLDDGSLAFHVHPRLSRKGGMTMSHFPSTRTDTWCGKASGRPDVLHSFLVAPVDGGEEGTMRNDLIVNPEDPSTLPLEYMIGRSGDIVRRKRAEIIQLKQELEKMPQKADGLDRFNPFKRPRPGEEDERVKMSAMRKEMFGPGGVSRMKGGK
eukprot:GHVH01004878.1.p1 GENE.GHVH01004878.1~~GHVH01004878.1.p1  ORF type:complete len:541 (+),score=71.00 GHVH01004878.1:26-1648(+)